MSDRPTRDCQCKRANHQHGTNAAYTRDGCRCDPCRVAGMAYQKRYRLGVLRGTANSLVDAAPAREHIKKLSDLYGLTPGGIAGAAGISRTVMTRLTRGQARTTRATRDAILGVTIDTLPGTAFIRARGTIRRIQALACLGWSMTYVRERSGVHAQSLVWTDTAGELHWVTAETHRAIAKVYDDLAWKGQRVPVTARERRDATWAHRTAQKNGWVPPAMWDDIDLDDRPASTPAYKTISDMEARRQDAVDLIAGGYAPATVMGRLGIRTLRDLKLMLATAGRADLAEEAALAHQVWQDAA